MRILVKDLAYIAGFFDGEGCISGHMGRRHPSARISIGQKDPKILYWIQETLKIGRISKNSKSSNSSWRITRKEDIGRFIELILPYSIIKKEQLLVGQKLNNLRGGQGSRVSENNSQKRLRFFDRLKLLKRVEVV